MRKSEQNTPESLKKGVVLPPGFNSSFCIDVLLPSIAMTYVRGFEAKYGHDRENWPIIGTLEFAPLGAFKLPNAVLHSREIAIEQNLFFWEKGKKTVLPMGIIMETEKNFVLVFRGTLSAFEWYHDVLIRQVRSRLFPGKVHEGFKTLFKALVDDLPEPSTFTKPLIISGHSLGASLATLAAYFYKDLNPHVYLFGSPRTGSQSFAKAYNEAVTQTFRVENAFDLVPELPPEELYVLKEQYKHVGNRVYVYANKQKLEEYQDLKNRDVLLGHFPSIYLKAVKNMLK